jgi:hypothetical protein
MVKTPARLGPGGSLVVYVILPPDSARGHGPEFHAVAHMLARSALEDEQGLSPARKPAHLCTAATSTSADDAHRR